jgi:GAF domain-containing protein
MEECGGLAGWRRGQLELSRLADEQTASLRVATMVALQGTAEEIFATIAVEVAQLVAADHGVVWRYEPGGSMTVAAGSAGGRPELTTSEWIEHRGTR